MTSLAFIATNCLSTAYEIALKRPDSFSLYLVQNAAFQNLFKEGGPGLKKVPAAEKKPGDILSIVSKTDSWVAHAATLVLDDLYFEKSGASCDSLYRLIDLDSIESTYDPTHFEYTYLRPNPTKMKPPGLYVQGLKKLNSKEEVYFAKMVGDKHQKTNLTGLIVSIPYVYDQKTQRYSLERKSMSSDYFKSLLEQVPLSHTHEETRPKNQHEERL